jgi:hypothetical protein
MNKIHGLPVHTVQLAICGLLLVFSASSAFPQAGSGITAQLITARDTIGSTYVPIDNWVYPALDRLQALGFLDTAFLGLRPWTRSSIIAMLDQSADKIKASPSNEQALQIYLAVDKELRPRDNYNPTLRHPSGTFESAYVRALGIAGTPLCGTAFT